MRARLTTITQRFGGVILVASALVVFAGATGSRAFAEPGIATSDPAEAAILPSPPEVLKLCFSEPVEVEGQDAWAFSVDHGDGSTLGLNVVFAPDGSCVDIHPGQPSSEGVWRLDWLVHAQSDGSEGSGKVNFQVGELQAGETPVPALGEDNDDAEDPPILLIGLLIVGAVIVILGIAGTAVRLLRR
jgi:methionine-rich copper-binding protein CopC